MQTVQNRLFFVFKIQSVEVACFAIIFENDGIACFGGRAVECDGVANDNCFAELSFRWHCSILFIFMLIFMPVMDVGHVSMFMLGAGMLVLVGMGCLLIAVGVEIIIVAVNMFMHNRHVDVKVGMLFICQQQRAYDHQYGSDH